MGKTDPFKGKPAPPSKECILADLENAEEDDVVFKTQYPELPKARREGSQSETGDTSNSGVDPAEVNFTYDQVTRLLELHSQLQEEPRILQDRYEHLEKISQDVSESIAELKQAAEVILNKTKKK